TFLDSVDPFIFIQQVEHMDGKPPLAEFELHPNGAGRCGDDHAEPGKTVRIGHVERNVDKAGTDPSFANEPENDPTDTDIRLHDIDEHDDDQVDQPVAATNGRLQRTQ